MRDGLKQRMHANAVRILGGSVVPIGWNLQKAVECRDMLLADITRSLIGRYIHGSLSLAKQINRLHKP
jgi:hypothetical protein